MCDVLTTLGWYLCHLAFYVVPRIKGMQYENKHADTIPFFSDLCINISCAKFDKSLDSTSFSRELPLRNLLFSQSCSHLSGCHAKLVV